MTCYRMTHCSIILNIAPSLFSAIHPWHVVALTGYPGGVSKGPMFPQPPAKGKQNAGLFPRKNIFSSYGSARAT